MDQIEVLKKDRKKLSKLWQGPVYETLEAIWGDEPTEEKRIYQRLLTEFGSSESGRLYREGSLCELDIVRSKFKKKDHVEVFALKASWKPEQNEVSMESFGDGDEYMQTLEGSWFQVENCECASLMPRKDNGHSVVSSLLAWIRDQYSFMHDWSRRPWKDNRMSTELKQTPEVLYHRKYELIRRYFFGQMEWYDVEMEKEPEKHPGDLPDENDKKARTLEEVKEYRARMKTGCLVEKSYFNLEAKSVYFQFGPPPGPIVTAVVEEIVEGETKEGDPCYFVNCRDEKGLALSVMVRESQWYCRKEWLKKGAKVILDLCVPKEGYSAFTLA